MRAAWARRWCWARALVSMRASGVWAVLLWSFVGASASDDVFVAPLAHRRSVADIRERLARIDDLAVLTADELFETGRLAVFTLVIEAAPARRSTTRS